jgi:16S rRNA G527 N7-methylase RsmG
MILEKKLFEDYLNKLNLPEIPHLMGRFEHFHNLLLEHNKNVNLVSRKMPPQSYWVQHFLDSLLAVECLDFVGKSVWILVPGAVCPGYPSRSSLPDAR